MNINMSARAEQSSSVTVYGLLLLLLSSSSSVQGTHKSDDVKQSSLLRTCRIYMPLIRVEYSVGSLYPAGSMRY